MKKKIALIAITLIPFLSKGQIMPLVFNFDTVESVFIDTGLVGNVWQIGQPQKTYFNAAFTIPNAMVTDTINAYPNNCFSEFTVKTPTYINFWGGVSMSFFHKFQTDTLLDGGTILISNDGQSWVNILYSQGLIFMPFNYFQHNDSVTSLNEPGFSGQSDGWQQTSIYWNYPPGDTLWVKFKFTSDNIQTNKDGWMIDSLVFTYDLGIGIEKTMQKNSYHLAPNPIDGQSVLTFHQTDVNAGVFIYSITGQLINSIEKIENGQVILDQNSFVPGIYSFAIFQSEQKAIRGKLIVH